MKYFKVKREYDNVIIPQANSFLVANELYTEKEIEKLKVCTTSAFEEVNINKNNTYFFFGARFEKK